MADNNDAATRANDWEVVSLTASAYAAAPGPKAVDFKDGDKEVTPYEAETSHPLYMSRHFVFPSSELDNIATNPSSEFTEGSKKMDFGFSVEQETGTDGKEDGDLTLKGLDLSDAFGGLEFSEERDKSEDNIYKRAMSSLDDERAVCGYEQNVPVQEPTDVTNVSPCKAWWKRSSASLIAQAKETNTVWSIFIAAAVMGIVILGQHWQQEKWQILQLKWETTIGNEKVGRLMRPISPLRRAFVGGQRRDSFIRVGSHNDS